MKNICSICNNPLESKLIRDVKADGKSYDVYFCEFCKVGVTVPMPSHEELARLYSSGSYRSDEGKRFNPLIELFIYLSRLQRKRRIKEYIGSGSIFDIGCGRGLFLDVMRKDRWGVTGAEFDKETASYAKKVYGISVVSGDPEEWDFPAESFDVITINHVLEHLHKPAQMISECRRLLRKRGLLVCAVPNISSLQASAGKDAWFHLDIPCHIHHFSEDGLLHLLKNNSFKPIKIKRFDIEYNLFGWLQTLLNISGIKYNLFYSILKNPELRGKELANAKKKDILFTFVMLPFYLPLSFVLSALESLVLKRGGTIEVYAVKE